MLTQKKFEQTPVPAAAAGGPRVVTVESGAVQAANAGRLGRAEALDRRLRRQRRRSRAGLHSRREWSIGLW